MSRFLLGALAMGAILVLASFALSSSATRPGGPAWKVSEYQLDRAFRVNMVLSGQPLVCQVPATGGFIITQMRTLANAGGCGGDVLIDINGATEKIYGSYQEVVYHTFNPPIIARPNDIVTISSPGGCPNVVFAGYTTVPGET